MIALLGLALVPFANLDPTSGIFRPAQGAPASWKVNEHHALLWNNEPYIPVGVRIDTDDASIQSVKSGGIGDVLVKLPTGVDWSGTVKKLEGNGLRYLISVDGLAPGAKGIAVEPQTYRITGLTESRKVEFPLPGASNALAVLVTARDATVIKSVRVPIVEGRFTYDAELQGGMEHILLVYPEVVTQSRPDYWERFDVQRDQLLTALKKANVGPGFRGLVNPMGDYVAFQAGNFVPTSTYFRMEFRQFLENRYRNVETLQRAWALSANDLTTFDLVARLVPLWSGSRGIPYAWDPVTDRQYRCNNRASTIWADVQSTVNAAAARRFDRLVAAIRQIADVPVVQDWRGWAAPYEASKPSLTGVGIRAHGSTPSALAESAGRGASSLLRWPFSGWMVATDIDTGKVEESSPLGNAISDLGAMGARGFFFRTSHPDWLAAEMKSTDLTLSQWSPTPLFFPESASNPASPQRLPSGRYWLPSPIGGNRVDLGSSFFAYRYGDRESAFTAIWTTGGTGRVKMRLSEPKLAKFTTLDGSDPKVKLSKNGAEVTLGQFPLIVSGTEEVPIPEAAFAETAAKFGELKKLAEALKRDIATEEYAFRDASQAFERSPGGSFIQMRRAYWTATVRLAPYIWLEAETSRTTNFSEVLTVSGANSSAVLALTSPSTLDARGFFAEYTVPVRSEDVEIWVAARISPAARKSLRVNVGGQELTALEEPSRPYGPGFAWYRMGPTTMRGASMKITLQVFGDDANDVWVDTVLITPPSMAPRGPLPPELLGG